MKDLIAIVHEPVIIAGIFTLLGSLIGVITTLVTTRIESNNHVREMGLKLALVNLEQRLKEQQALADATGQAQEVLPLPILVAESMRVAEIVSNPRLSPDEVGRRLVDLGNFAGDVLAGMKSKQRR